jgi:hypothetical protein
VDIREPNLRPGGYRRARPERAVVRLFRFVCSDETQFREVVMGDQPYRFVLHDRDRIYSSELDSVLQAMDLKAWKTPFQAPQASAFCERWIGPHSSPRMPGFSNSAEREAPAEAPQGVGRAL